MDGGDGSHTHECTTSLNHILNMAKAVLYAFYHNKLKKRNRSDAS